MPGSRIAGFVARCDTIDGVLAERAARRTHSSGSEAGNYPSMTHKEFTSYFHPEFFIADLKATSKDKAIEEIVAHLVERRQIKNGTVVVEALKKRESLGSTGIGKSLAIPHGRTTVTGKLTVAYARSIAGISWESIDHKPVHFIFLILAPHQEKENHYLPLLGKIVEFARDAAVRKRLLKVETHEELLGVLDGAKAAS